MGWLLRGALALALLLAVAVGALALLLPRIAASDAVRERLTEAVEDATARRFSYRELRAGLLPPRLELAGAALGDAGEEAARAERVSLEVALLPLLGRVVLVDALVVEGARMELERTEHGVQLPGTSLAKREEPEDDAEPDPERSGGEGLALAIRTVRVPGAHVALRDPSGEDAALGPFDLAVDFAGPPAAPRGRFRLALEGGEATWGDALRKPAGVPAHLEGTAVQDGEAWRVDDVSLRLGPLDAMGRVSVEPPALLLDSPPFAVAELLALLPALADVSLAGRAALEGFTLAGEPLALGGRIVLDPAELGDFEGEPLVLRGALRGEGADLVSEGLRASLAGQEASVALALRDVFGAQRAELDTEAEDLDSAALLAALAGESELLEGPLDLRAHLVAQPTDPEPLGTLSGRVELSVAPGRLRGVSLLRGTVEAAGPVGDAALLAGRASGSESAERFYEDEFESLGGSFDVVGGVARTDDLRLVYRAYQVDLRGTLALDSLALDMTGRLTLEPEADAAFTGEDEGRRRVIQLARVTGTVEAPRVALSREAVAMLASLYATDRRREKWERKLDEKLGEGSGRQLLDLLDQVLEGQAQGGDAEEGATP